MARAGSESQTTLEVKPRFEASRERAFRAGSEAAALCPWFFARRVRRLGGSTESVLIDERFSNLAEREKPSQSSTGCRDQLARIFD